MRQQEKTQSKLTLLILDCDDTKCHEFYDKNADYSPLPTSRVIDSVGGLGLLIPTTLFALTRNWYTEPGVRSSTTVDVVDTNGTGACQWLTPVSLHSTVYAVIALLPSLAGGFHFTMTDEDVISVTIGFEGDEGLSRTSMDSNLFSSHKVGISATHRDQRIYHRTVHLRAAIQYKYSYFSLSLLRRYLFKLPRTCAMQDVVTWPWSLTAVHV